MEFPTLEVVQQLTERMMYLFNGTRRRILKGHTSDELFQKEKQHQIRSLPPYSFNLDRDEVNVIDLKTCKKVGRNEPCPCGSGKKYKKCCGK